MKEKRRRGGEIYAGYYSGGNLSFFPFFFFFFVASLQGKIKRKRAKRKICNQNNSKEARPEKHDYNNNK
jgi:hypothetical protein